MHCYWAGFKRFYKMILYLNLLPQPERKQIQLTRWYIFLQKEMAFLLVLVLLLSGAIYYARIFLKDEAEQIDISLEKNKENNKALIFEAQRINQLTASFQSVQAGFNRKSELLFRLSSLVPSGIVLTALSLNGDNYVTLQGFYQKRDNLIKFKNDLTDSGFMANVDFPISNLLNQENGTFDIKGNIIVAAVPATLKTATAGSGL